MWWTGVLYSIFIETTPRPIQSISRTVSASPFPCGEDLIFFLRTACFTFLEVKIWDFLVAAQSPPIPPAQSFLLRFFSSFFRYLGYYPQTSRDSVSPVFLILGIAPIILLRPTEIITRTRLDLVLGHVFGDNMVFGENSVLGENSIFVENLVFSENIIFLWKQCFWWKHGV